MTLLFALAASASTVVGDFDRDGLADRAYVRGGGTAAVVVRHGDGRTSTVYTAERPGELYVAKLAHGRYATACGKRESGGGPPCRARSIAVRAPTLAFGSSEASKAAAVWDGKSFRVVWLSD